MRRVLWRLGIPVAAFLGGVVGSVPVFALGLGVPIYTPGPLALGTSALLSALAAGWVGNIAPPTPQQSTRSRIPAVLAASGVGVVLALLVGVSLLFVLPRLLSISDPYSMIGVTLATYGVCFPILALAASFATWRYREPQTSGLGFFRIAALALSVVGLIVLFGLILLMGSGGALAYSVVAGFGVTLTLSVLGAVFAARVGA